MWIIGSEHNIEQVFLSTIQLINNGVVPNVNNKGTLN